jgi:hypothetical protein
LLIIPQAFNRQSKFLQINLHLVIKGHLVGSHVSLIAGKRQFSANPDIVD